MDNNISRTKETAIANDVKVNIFTGLYRLHMHSPKTIEGNPHIVKINNAFTGPSSEPITAQATIKLITLQRRPLRMPHTATGTGHSNIHNGASSALSALVDLVGKKAQRLYQYALCTWKFSPHEFGKSIFPVRHG